MRDKQKETICELMTEVLKALEKLNRTLEQQQKPPYMNQLENLGGYYRCYNCGQLYPEGSQHICYGRYY